MSFANPYLLSLLFLLPLMLDHSVIPRMFSGKFSKAQGRREEFLFSSPISLSALPFAPRARLRVWLLSSLRILAFTSLVISTARPQRVTSFAEVESSGRDVMLALDISGSMRALDFELEGQTVNRLTALKYVVKDFIQERRGDRLGLVIFGSDVYTQCPLTNDQNILAGLVDGLEIGMVGDGTALGDGLALAVKRLRSIEQNSKVIVLVTDGVKTAGTIDPKEAAELAKEKGIKVYTIGIGGTKPAPMPVQDIFGNPRVQYMPVELDEKTLRAIAEITGAKYFHAEDTGSLKEVYAEISKLEERIIQTQEYTEYREEYLPFLLFGLLLFVIHEVLVFTRYAVIP